MNLQNISIHQAVIDVLSEKVGISMDVLDEKYWDTPLTGRHFRLSAVDLTYIFFELEKTLGLRFGEKHLSDYGFSTINEITETLRKSMELASTFSLA